MYESGVFIALILWVVSAIYLLVKINSQEERNLRKVGFRHSWLTWKPKPLSAEAQSRSLTKNLLKFFFLQTLTFIGIFLSWMYVVAVLLNFAYGILRDLGAPNSVKEFRWRMRNLDMSVEQINAGINSIAGYDVDSSEK